MNLSQFAINRPVTTAMVILCIIVLGVLSWFRLPLLFIPEIEGSHLRVYVPYSSSSPFEVQREITIPLEDALATVTHLESLESTSSANSADVRLEFKQGIDMDMASLEVRDRIDRVRGELPDDVERIMIRRWQSSDMPVLSFSVAWHGGQAELYDIVTSTIHHRLQRIDGVANVDIRGMNLKSVVIDVQQDRLRSHGVDVYNLRQALRHNNMNLSAGEVSHRGREFSVRVIGEFQEIEQIRNLPIGGKRVRLGDVAEVRYDYPERRRFQHLDGEEAVSLSVYKASNANVVDVCRQVVSALEDIRGEVSADQMLFRVYRNQSESILNSLGMLQKSGLMGAAIAIGVLFLFLRKLRSTMIIALAIPMSVIFVFLLMYLMRLNPINWSISINIVSLMGMAYAVGMVVDPAIVVLENIYRHKQEEGLDARSAAVLGAQEVGVAVLAATLTSVIVFVSLIFTKGGHFARFMQEFGAVICLVLTGSLIVALTVVPLLAAHVFTGKEKEVSKFQHRSLNVYTRLIRLSLGHRWATLGAVVLLAVVTWQLYLRVDRDYMPSSSDRSIRFRVTIPRGMGIENVAALFDTVETRLLSRRDELDIASISTDYGRGRGSDGFRGSLNVYLLESGQAALTVDQAKERIDELLPVLPGVIFRERQRHGMGGGRQGISIELSGSDTKTLAVYAEQIRERLEGIEGVKNVDTSLESGDEEVQISVDRTKAQRHGISPTQVARTVASALSDRAASKFKTPDREVDITLQLREEDRMSLQQLQNVTFENPKAEAVPLYSVANFAVKRTPEAIRREGRRPRVSVSARTSRMGMLTVSRSIQNALADIKLPPGYSWQMGSNYQRWRESEQDFKTAIILALVFMYLIMASLFESFIHPVTIMFSVLFAGIGIIGALLLSGARFDNMVVLGTLLACGLVVNNGIILIDHITHLRREGMSRYDAIILGGRHRVRPILMTAATTCLGLLPMVVPLVFPGLFGPLEGRAGFWAPVGLAIFGGLSSSTILTLVILPTIYTIFDDFGIWMRKVWTAA